MEPNLQQNRHDLIWLDTPPDVRSTRVRLCIALGMAASTILLALLTIDVNLYIDPLKSAASRKRPLTVDIRRSEPRQGLDSGTGGNATAPAGDEQSSTASQRVDADRPRSRRGTDAAAEPSVEAGPAADWDALKRRIARETVEEHWIKERARASMWRQTRSVMFRADSDAGVGEDVPLIADLNFREPAGVLGLGFTIGSCFVGIPLAGIPVEERSTAITLFYCRE